MAAHAVYVLGTLLLLSASPATVGAQEARSGGGPGYLWWCLGAPTACDAFGAPSSLAVPGIALVGGPVGEDGPPEMDPTFDWLIDRSAGGYLLVLGAGGDDSYDGYLWALAAGRLSAVWTLNLTSPLAATQPFVVAAAASASSVFLMGGDQTLYVERIGSSTPLAAELTARAALVPFGGTVRWWMAHAGHS